MSAPVLAATRATSPRWWARVALLLWAAGCAAPHSDPEHIVVASIEPNARFGPPAKYCIPARVLSDWQKSHPGVVWAPRFDTDVVVSGSDCVGRWWESDAGRKTGGWTEKRGWRFADGGKMPEDTVLRPTEKP